MYNAHHNSRRTTLTFLSSVCCSILLHARAIFSTTTVTSSCLQADLLVQPVDPGTIAVDSPVRSGPREYNGE